MSGHPKELSEAEAAAERRELIASVDRFLVRYYGERCSTVNGGCACCVAWAARDVLNASILEFE